MALFGKAYRLHIGELTDLATVEAEAAGGHPQAEQELGDRYSQGNENTYPGRCYRRNGNGVGQDRLLALHWWGKALANPQWKEYLREDLRRHVHDELEAYVEKEAQGWRKAIQDRIDDKLREIHLFRDVAELKALAKLHLHGASPGVAKDRMKGLGCYLIAAERGDAEAQLELAYLYEWGSAVRADNPTNANPADHAHAKTWCAAALDNPAATESPRQEATNRLANLRFYIDHRREAAAKTAYESGEQSRLAGNLGKALRQYRQAVRLCEAPFEQPHLEKIGPFYGIVAAWSIGNLYASDTGARDDLQAAVWWRKAAQWGQSLSFARATLGYAYLDGVGMAKDHAKACEWLSSAVREGSADQSTWAMRLLAGMHERGEHVASDPAQAYAWYRRAALEGGDLGSRIDVGRLLMTGAGVARDVVEARALFDSVLTSADATRPQMARAKRYLAELQQLEP